MINPTQEELSAYRSHEYQDLRNTMATVMANQKEWSIYALGAVVSALGASFALANPFPELCLVPLIIVLIAAEKVHNLKMCVERLAAYLIVKHEHPAGASWESSLLKWRLQEKQCTHDRNKFLLLCAKISEFIVTQEFTIMALMCVCAYVMSLYDVTCSQSELDIGVILLRSTLLLIGIAVVVYIFVITRHYNDPKAEAVKQLIARWETVLREDAEPEERVLAESDEISPGLTRQDVETTIKDVF